MFSITGRKCWKSHLPHPPLQVHSSSPLRHNTESSSVKLFQFLAGISLPATGKLGFPVWHLISSILIAVRICMTFNNVGRSSVNKGSVIKNSERPVSNLVCSSELRMIFVTVRYTRSDWKSNGSLLR